MRVVNNQHTSYETNVLSFLQATHDIKIMGHRYIVDRTFLTESK